MAAYWGIVPAAGIGRRMNNPLPKQYLSLVGKRIVEHSIAPLLSCSSIAKLVVALSADDRHWQHTSLHDNPQIRTCIGGENRAQSVRNALQQLKSEFEVMAEDWAIVHDAVRPCLRSDDIERLIAHNQTSRSGTILAIPIDDSLKRVQRDAACGLRAVATVQRSEVWMRAVTPQMFRYGLLCDALDAALAAGHEIDDEAAAIQHFGHEVQIVLGDYRNIKITRSADLDRAQLYLSGEQR